MAGVDHDAGRLVAAVRAVQAVQRLEEQPHLLLFDLPEDVHRCVVIDLGSAERSLGAQRAAATVVGGLTAGHESSSGTGGGPPAALRNCAKLRSCARSCSESSRVVRYRA